MTPSLVDDLAAELRGRGLRVCLVAALADYTTFQLGGTCPLLVDCQRPEELQLAWRLATDAGAPVRLIGGGSNLLVSEHGLPECILRFADGEANVRGQDGSWELPASVAFDRLAECAAAHGVGGLLQASGIPGTLGGAVVGNAGAFGWQIGDSVESVELLEPDGTITQTSPEALGFAYRYSDLRDSGRVVLRVRVRAERTRSIEEAQAERLRILELRAEKHPNLQTDPCAGSFFRNIEPTSSAGRRQAAGWFLERAGAKGMRVGGAAVFAKHANIIVKADDRCKASDVQALSLQMAALVQQEFSLTLVPEVRAIGVFPG